MFCCTGPRSAIGRAPDSLVRGPGFDTRSGNILSFLLPLFQEGQLSVTGEVLVNHLGGLSLPRKSVVGLTDCPDMTLDVYRGRKTTIQQQHQCSAEAAFLRHCRPNFENDAVKTIPAGHLAHTDLWPVTGLLSVKAVWKIPMPKITFFSPEFP